LLQLAIFKDVFDVLANGAFSLAEKFSELFLAEADSLLIKLYIQLGASVFALVKGDLCVHRLGLLWCVDYLPVTSFGSVFTNDMTLFTQGLYVAFNGSLCDANGFCQLGDGDLCSFAH